MNSLSDSYQSNIELDYFTNQLAKTENSLENYLNYHTFESIDSYYSNKEKVVEIISNMQNFPSTNQMVQNEYLVNQLTQSFIYFCDKAIAARRANNFEEANFYYNKSLSCYPLLLSQLLELNKMRLQDNAINYNKNTKNISLISTLSFLFFSNSNYTLLL